ncbi:ATP-binding cassette domain-containing protein [Candidatus Mycobacterium methanotrophicum]|uniref:ATP-binding cassette domain-containing protein n=2 Tax=Candidatus Mycobacterium methanotrophicum TaxID=2943498 RepID=A0ABY4QNB2_9MYCO|nr:ATP-binding cassette domain-containing protein [Candidatus Mycobacterium methanotrophicum]UQX12492.1 ATP-binding cassette domain-containing protein [Candidatus Mycobacterium methanotrophicum]
MSRPAPPMLTIWHDGSQHTFAAGQDVVVGRDVDADVRIADPRISREHLILRFEHGKWLAIDNGSVNGTFVNGYRTPVIDVRDGQSINVGNAGGPQLSFEVGQHRGRADRPPQGGPPRNTGPSTVSWSTANPPRRPRAPGSAQSPTPRRHPAPHARNVSHPSTHDSPTDVHVRTPPPGPPPAGTTVVNAGSAPPRDLVAPNELTVVGARPGEVSNLATRFVKFLSQRSAPPAKLAGSVTIGRASDNDIVIPDVLASRHHAALVLTPLGTEIQDRSINGTFVNGTRVGSAILTEGDVVTIGNVDLVLRGGLLVARSETETATRTGGLEVRGVDYIVDNGKQLLDNISVTARPGTLTAVIGGSGAGKSTLARLIAGYTTPSSGSVTFEGHDVHAEYASLRSRIGMVPQDDVVHRQLTVNQALGYAAELRLPPDTTKADRAKVVAQVLDELDLTKHADTRVDKLSGGQRKRASVALELLTGPSLLILDEPTSGLDPALDHQVMTMLRQLADAGRVVIVVTHMLSYLDTCDQLLLVAPGGKTAYCGPPDQIGDAMGTTNWAKIFGQVGADPEEANRRFLERGQQPPPAAADQPADLGEPVHTSVRRQISTIARRQVRLVVADRAYFVFLALLPFILGALSLTVPGSSGFGIPGLRADTPDESAQILALLLPAAAFMGTALTIRDLVGERPVFQREQAVGLSTTAYLLAKTAVFCGFAVLQSAIVTAIVVTGKGAPTRGAVLMGHSGVTATVELFTTVAATCVASAILGLAISSLVRSTEQIMPLFVVAVMAQLVLCGGMVPVTGRLGLNQLSWLMPARWGYAAASSTVDVRHLVPGSLLPQDRFWQHAPEIWLFDMGMLAVLAVFYAGFVRWKIRLRR